jgi:hypothetical protein
MAPKSNKNKTKKGKGRASRAIKIPKSVGNGLDSVAAKYAQLLADPCTGPLVSGPFGDGTGGIVARYEQDVIVDAFATSAASVLVFCPSALTYHYSATALTSDTTGFFPIVPGNTANHAGLVAMQAQGGTFRVLSACLQTYYPGTELTRAGITGVGQAPLGAFGGASGTTAANMRSLANYVERTPEQSAEIVWRPSEFDLQWTQANNIDVITSSNEFRRSGLFSCSSGIPVSTGMRYRMVAVIEWVPGVAFGQPSIIRTPTSNNTLTHVLNTLDKYGDWAYHGALAVGNTASKLYGAAQMVGRVSYGVTKMAAIMAG